MKTKIGLILLMMTSSVFSQDFVEGKIQKKNYMIEGNDYEISYTVVPGTKNISASVTKAPVQLMIGISPESASGEYQVEQALCSEIYTKKAFKRSVKLYNSRSASVQPVFPAQKYDFENSDLRISYISAMNNLEDVQSLFLNDFSNYSVKFFSSTGFLDIKYSSDSRYQAIEGYERSKDALAFMKRHLTDSIETLENLFIDPVKVKLDFKYLWCDLLEGKAKITFETEAYVKGFDLVNIKITEDKKLLTTIVKDLYSKKVEDDKVMEDSNKAFLVGMHVGRVINKYKYKVNNLLEKKYGLKIYEELFLNLYDLRNGLKLKYDSPKKAINKMLYTGGSYNPSPKYYFTKTLRNTFLSGSVSLETELMEAPLWKN